MPEGMNGDFKKWWDQVRQVTSYMLDPDISQHDKDMQHALDCPLPDPVKVEKRLREDLAILSSDEPYLGFDQREYRGYDSLEELRAELERRLQPENLEESRARYAMHQALVEEALSKGFVKDGNCNNVR